MQIQCAKCGANFDPIEKAKLRIGGMFSHCADCSKETKPFKTGAMISTHKTGSVIQIQEGGPEGEALSKALNRNVQAQMRSAVPVTHGAVAKLAEVSQSRQGATQVSVPRFELPEPIMHRPGSGAALPKTVAAVWYDPSERKLFRIADGKMYEAPVEGVTWTRTGLEVTRLARQKGLLASLLSTVTNLLKEATR